MGIPGNCFNFIAIKFTIEQDLRFTNEISIGTRFMQIVNDNNGYSMWLMKYKIIHT